MEDKYFELIQKKRAGALSDEDKASIREIMQDPEQKEELAFQILLQLALEEKREEEDEAIKEMLADRKYTDEKKASGSSSEPEVKKGKRTSWNRLFWLGGLLMLIAIIWFILDLVVEPNSTPSDTPTKVERVIAEIPREPGIFSSGFWEEAGSVSQDGNIDTLFYQACLDLFKALEKDYTQIIACFDEIEESYFSATDQVAPSDYSFYFYQGWFYLKRGKDGDIQKAYQAFSKAEPQAVAKVSEQDITFYQWLSLLLLDQQADVSAIPNAKEKLSKLKSRIEESKDYNQRVKRIMGILSEKN